MYNDKVELRLSGSREHGGMIMTEKDKEVAPGKASAQTPCSNFVRCSCGCTEIYIGVTDKNPQKGVCVNCRKDVDLRGRMIFLA